MVVSPFKAGWSVWLLYQPMRMDMAFTPLLPDARKQVKCPLGTG